MLIYLVLVWQIKIKNKENLKTPGKGKGQTYDKIFIKLVKYPAGANFFKLIIYYDTINLKKLKLFN